MRHLKHAHRQSHAMKEKPNRGVKSSFLDGVRLALILATTRRSFTLVGATGPSIATSVL
jgi:hypothetical protein